LYDRVLELKEILPFLGNCILSSSKIFIDFSNQSISKEQSLENLKHHNINVSLTSIDNFYFLDFKILSSRFNFSPFGFNSDKDYVQLEKEINIIIKRNSSVRNIIIKGTWI